MDFRDCINQNRFVLMEGALGERLKREYSITFDEQIAMAGLIYEEKGAFALKALWNEYSGCHSLYRLCYNKPAGLLYDQLRPSEYCAESTVTVL